MFCGVLPLVWGVGGAARGAFLTRRTLGSFLMRRGGIVINGLLFDLLRPHKRRSPSKFAMHGFLCSSDANSVPRTRLDELQ